MRGYQRRAREFTRNHPWLTGAMFGLYMALAEALFFHETIVPAAITGIFGFAIFGYYMRMKARPGRITEREILLVLGAIALVMCIVLAIRAMPR